MLLIVVKVAPSRFEEMEEIGANLIHGTCLPRSELNIKRQISPGTKDIYQINTSSLTYLLI